MARLKKHVVLSRLRRIKILCSSSHVLSSGHLHLYTVPNEVDPRRDVAPRVKVPLLTVGFLAVARTFGAILF